MNALISNAARHPAATLTNIEKMPVMLRDESVDTVVTVAKIWAKEGYRSRVLELVNREGVTPGMRYAIVRALKEETRTVH